MNLGKKNSKQLPSSTFDDAYLKAAAYCAYQERSQLEVRNKLNELFVRNDTAEEIIAKLIQDNFINEERFACVYAGGKFRIKKWGRNKIRQALKSKGVSDYCCKKGLSSIDEEDYIREIQILIEKKVQSIETKITPVILHKVAQYVIAKGFESDLVFSMLKEIES